MLAPKESLTALTVLLFLKWALQCRNGTPEFPTYRIGAEKLATPKHVHDGITLSARLSAAGPTNGSKRLASRGTS